MSNMERTTGWQQIQLGVKDAERLIARKEYNLVMVKARQVLEYMVRCMAERACLVEGDLSETIDELYNGCWISRETKDNYHTIRILGNKAVHEGGAAAHDANQAFKLLNQEVYVFAEKLSGQPGKGQARQARSAPSARQGAQGRSDRVRQNVRARSGSGGNRRPSNMGNAGGRRKKKRRQTLPSYYMWRLLIPLLVVVLLIVVIRAMAPSGGRNKKEAETAAVTTAAPITTAVPETAPTPAPEPETAPETENPAVKYKVKGSSVNVRKEPSKDSRILVQLAKGTEVDFVKRYNNDWYVINYNGKEAYVSSQFLEKETPPSSTALPSESGTAQAAQ